MSRATSSTHDEKGADDMPAHVKSSLVGSSVTIPISNGRLDLGTWQDIWLCEHHNLPTARSLIATYSPFIVAACNLGYSWAEKRYCDYETFLFKHSCNQRPSLTQ
jgi:hypothetical protein